MISEGLISLADKSVEGFLDWPIAPFARSAREIYVPDGVNAHPPSHNLGERDTVGLKVHAAPLDFGEQAVDMLKRCLSEANNTLTLEGGRL